MWRIATGLGVKICRTNLLAWELDIMEDYSSIITFVKELERLKNHTRTAWTSTGRHESIAEHSWRLSLFILVLEDDFPEIDFHKVLRMSLIHDLGEAYEGDISAKEAIHSEEKLKKEEEAISKLIEPLNLKMQHHLISLWSEYNEGETMEAKLVKALDKMETIIQHNQGDNSSNFDYQFNMDYGKEYSTFHPIIQSIRELIDRETDMKIKESKS